MGILTNSYKRKLSGNESIYSSCEKIYPPFCVQVMIEGKGNIGLSELKQAVGKVAAANPDCTVILKGSYWQSSDKLPLVTGLSENEFEAENLNNYYFRKRIDFINGPVCEIYLVKGRSSKILFRSFHGVMDARGLLLWVENIFRALNNKQLTITNTEINDDELLKNFNQKGSRGRFRAEYPSPTGKEEGKNKNFIWKRERIPGNYSGLVAKLAYILALETGKYTGRKTKFMIPVDLRNQAKTLFSLANLSNPLFIEINGEKSWTQVYENIIRQLKNNNEKKYGKFEKFLYLLPRPLIGRSIRLLYNSHLKNNSFFATGVISHIGKINNENFSTEYFKAESVFFLPFDVPGSPLSIAIVENEGFVEISFSAPECLGNNGRLDNLVKSVKKQLNSLKDENEIIFDEKSFNNTLTEYPKDKTIFQLFEEQVNKTPDRTALISGNESITYRQLFEKSRAAASLIKNEKETGAPVIGVLLEHSFNTVITILGILQAGFAYLPISTETPAERILFMLNDAGCSLLVSNRPLTDHAPNLKVITTDQFENSFSGTFTWQEGHPEDLVYLIYTSGSTGLPKAVEISNRSLVNYCWWAKETYLEKDEKYCFPLYTSIAFDLSVTSVFVPLISGNSICIYPESVSTLNSIIKDNKANIIKLTPAHLKLLKELNLSESVIKKIIVGGEAFPVSLAKEINGKFKGNIEIYNEYGPTEATVGCMIHRFNPEEDKGPTVPIGKPAANTSIYLLDESLQWVEPGSTGEIYISGDGTAKGYRNREELNKNRFTDDPFREGNRMYKTGDLAVATGTNLLEYLGRNDDQVKIRGYRIEPSEIENILCAVPGIKQCLVLAQRKGNISGSDFLTAYYVSESRYDAETLRAFLSARLPEYMVPVFFIRINEIPLTINGKVDKKALPLPEITENHEMIIEDELTMQLINLLAEILNIPPGQITPAASLFELGCDSLLMAVYLTRVSEKLMDGTDEVFSNLEELIKKPTVSNLSGIIRLKRNSKTIRF